MQTKITMGHLSINIAVLLNKHHITPLETPPSDEAYKAGDTITRVTMDFRVVDKMLSCPHWIYDEV